MPSKKPDPILPIHVDDRIYEIRGVRVLLDSELAEMYGVPTKVLNQAVERNIDRFPDDFAFVLSEQEFEILRSQIVTTKPGRGGRRYLPRVFTEQGVAMLSGLLRSPMAVAVNIEIMRAFVRMRRLFAAPGDLVTQLQQLMELAQYHDEQIKLILDALESMSKDETSQRRIGFLQPEHKA